jgi:uncharacterized protein with HEPN domain
MPRERSGRTDAASLLDIIVAGESIARYLGGKTRADFDADEMFRAAVERKIEIIGEAACRISETFRAQHPMIPWRKVIGTRHVLAHDYDEVNTDIVWKIATEYVPELLSLIKPLLPPPPPDPEPEQETP